MAATSIEWTDVTWNPVTGCRKVSPGCAHCYAERVFPRAYARASVPVAGLGPHTLTRPRRFEDVRMHPDRLEAPLRWRFRRRVFVNSMSDLFHEDVPDDFIAAVFAVMHSCPLHDFQVLTKRPDRARRFLMWMQERGGVGEYVRSDAGRNALRRHFDAVARFEVTRGQRWRAKSDPWMWIFNAAAINFEGPEPNVWLGVSCEDQQRADERIPLLLDTPAAVRFVSAEPLLGPIDFTRLPLEPGHTGSALEPSENHEGDGVVPALDWIIVGGESGPGARPCDVAWIRDIVGQCLDGRVACFVKQVGTYAYQLGATPPSGDLRRRGISGAYLRPRDRKGGDPDEWPADLRVREFPKVG